MKVLVTGGTGFVGSHTVAAVLGAGHEVRMLARSPERVRPALDPLGAGDVEVVTGDVLDGDSVRRALDGCDAVIHGASVYSVDARKNREILRTNAPGTEIVLGLAVEAGLDPIVHVSSVASMIDRDGMLTPDTEPGTPPGAYVRSKADSERVARRFQAQGAPVVAGPHDPYLGETCQALLNALKGRYRMVPAGGMVMCDVRDVARLNAAVLERGRGPRRYFVPSALIEVREFLRHVEAASGRRLPTTLVPAWMVLPSMRVADVLQLVLPFRLPLDFQGTYFVSRFHSWTGWDDSRTVEEFGIERPDAARMIEETLQWMAGAGHVPSKVAGRLAEG
jgi:dihydroflavonol-4-reductase